ncbi:MAG TPA: FAD-binding oxidoreductase [Acetobacteraceae bacterium]|nr:FAD-binding oxidoreductase [Acetobacteraceae bacterium]
MSTTAAGTYAIVIGGGLHGLSTAVHLALKGLHPIVIEKNTVGRHASSVNAGGVRQLRRHPAEIPLSVAAMDRWMNLGELLGEHAPLCEFVGNVGQIAVAETEDDLRPLEARVAELHRLGWTHEELIDRAELRRLAPALSEHCIGGLISRRDGYATPYSTVQAFRLRALDVGVRIEEGVRVTGLEHGARWKVQTSKGRFESDVVVNCGGAWGWEAAAMAGEVLPRGYFAPAMMVTTRMPHFLDPVVLGTGRKLSFKQTNDGTVVIGGGIFGVPDRDAETADPVAERMRESAQTCCALFPIMRRATIVRTWAGLEARMPDEIPVIGASQTAPNMWHAFGFSGHGFQLGPMVGSLLADLIVEGKSPLPIEAFRPGRFNS